MNVRDPFDARTLRFAIDELDKLILKDQRWYDRFGASWPLARLEALAEARAALAAELARTKFLDRKIPLWTGRDRMPSIEKIIRGPRR